MAAEQLVSRIRQLDWTILEDETPIDPSVTPAVAPLLQNDTDEVRELALHVIDRANAPQTTELLGAALDDPAGIVRATAIGLLGKRLTPDLMPLLTTQLTDNADEYVREQAALLIGQVGGRPMWIPFKKAFAGDDDAGVRRAVSLALARMKEPEHRDLYLAEYQENNPAGLVKTLHDLPYVNDSAVVPVVLPLLGDLREAEQVGPSHADYMIRVCDIAINELSALLGAPFPFEVTGFKRYSVDELRQAREVLNKR